jgi:hypothetical protein
MEAAFSTIDEGDPCFRKTGNNLADTTDISFPVYEDDLYVIISGKESMDGVIQYRLSCQCQVLLRHCVPHANAFATRDDHRVFMAHPAVRIFL